MPALADVLPSPPALAALAFAAVLAAGVTLLAVLAFRARRRSATPVVYPPAAEPVAEEPAEGTRGADVLRLFGPLRPGDLVDGFRLAGLYEDDRGCVPVLLEGPDGARFRVDVLRRSDDDPLPPAATDRLALYLAGMRPRSVTPEASARVMRALARALSEIAAEPPPWLLTMGERARLLAGPPSGAAGRLPGDRERGSP